MGCVLLVLGVEGDGAGRLALVEGFLEAAEHFVLYFGLLVATGLCLFLHAGDAAFDGLEVLQLQLVVDDFLVAHRVDRSVDVNHVRVVEATEHMNDGVRLADVGEELVAKTFAFRSTLHKTCDVDNLDRCRHDALRVDDFCELVESLVGHGDYAHVRFNRTEREVCRLRFGVRQAVEKSGLAHVRQSDNTTL